MDSLRLASANQKKRPPKWANQKKRPPKWVQALGYAGRGEPAGSMVDDQKVVARIKACA
jgi:hypothetical protein